MQELHRLEIQKLNAAAMRLETRLDEQILANKAASIRSAELLAEINEQEVSIRYLLNDGLSLMKCGNE